jgi:hypothetical protein
VTVVSAVDQGVFLVVACSVLAGLLCLVTRWCTGRRPSWCRAVVRLSPVGVFYAGYILLIGYSERPAVLGRALWNGMGIERVERSVGLCWESWLSHHTIPLSNGYYGVAQLVVTFSLLIWLSVFAEPWQWGVARNTLALISAGGFLCFWLFPVAPPWALPVAYGIHGAGAAGFSGVGDLMGAFPSLHTAWAGWAALVWWSMMPRHRLVQWLGWGNLVLTGVVVLTTGNHYLLDVVAGELLAAWAGYLAGHWEVGRSGVWSVSRRVAALL